MLFNINWNKRMTCSSENSSTTLGRHKSSNWNKKTARGTSLDMELVEDYWNCRKLDQDLRQT